MALSLITDRTSADVSGLKALRNKINASGWAALTAAEQATWTAGKGALNATDLNRVESAVAYLAAIIAGYGYPVILNTPKTNWTEGDEATDPDEFNEANSLIYLANVAAIKAAFYGTVALPTTMGNLTVEQANNIERLLLEIELYITRMVAGFHKCGTFKSGQGVVLP